MPANPILDLDPERVAEGATAAGLEAASDLDLLGWAAEIVAVPRREVTSFVLHAPLELLARYRLLAYVRPELKALARLQLLRFAAAYARGGEAVTVGPIDGGPDREATAGALLQALERGDADAAQALAAWLARDAAPEFLARALGQPMLQRLGAAAHGPIFLNLLLRLEPAAARAAGPMIAPLARELAAESDQRLTWTTPGAGGAGRLDAAGLERALLTSPRQPFAGGIFPIMRSAEQHGIPQAVVGSRIPGALADAADAEAGFAAICRVAALTMVEEGPHQAKYGWSHCLTLPQAVWGIADLLPDAAFALRAAATYVVGMRAAIGRKRRLEAAPSLPRSAPPLAAALGTSPQEAAAAGWRAGADDTEAQFVELASQASIRSDAHLVKYVLAAWDGARRDPASAPAYRAGAAFLTALWMQEQGLATVEQMLGVGRKAVA